MGLEENKIQKNYLTKFNWAPRPRVRVRPPPGVRVTVRVRA